MNVTKKFLEELDYLYRKDMPIHVMEKARNSMRDYVAVTVAGSEYLKEKINKYIEFAEPEVGEYKPIGLDKKLSLKDTVFINGLEGHALDFDDGTNAGIIHLGSPIFSLLLPLACKYKKTVQEVLKSAIIGYEASFTMAVSMQPTHKQMGYHATGTCGILGAVIAASYLLEFNQDEREKAFAIACVSATGVLQVLDDDSELKPYNVAKASLLALISLQMAKAGFKGHSDALGNTRGYLKMMAGDNKTILYPLLLNNTYAIEKTYTKPYAACRYLHPSIEAAIEIYKKSISIDDIEEIIVRTYSLAVNGHDHTEIYSSASAKMSIPYSVSVALVYGKAGLNEFDNIDNDNVLKLAKCVKVLEDNEMSNLFPEKQPSKIEIKFKNGNQITSYVEMPKGEPENPMSDIEFKERFDDLFMYANKRMNISREVFSKIENDNCIINEIMEIL